MNKLIVMGLLVVSSVYADGAIAQQSTQSQDNQSLDSFTRNKELKDQEQQFKKKLKNKGIPLFLRKVSLDVDFIGLSLVVENISNKTIKEFKVNFIGFNSVGDIASNELGEKGYSTNLVGPIKPKEEALYSYTPIIYNKETSCIEIKKISVEFMDGSEYTMTKDLATARFKESDYNIAGECS